MSDVDGSCCPVDNSSLFVFGVRFFFVLSSVSKNPYVATILSCDIRRGPCRKRSLYIVAVNFKTRNIYVPGNIYIYHIHIYDILVYIKYACILLRNKVTFFRDTFTFLPRPRVSRLRGMQGGRAYTRLTFGRRPRSLTRALGVQSRECWQVTPGSRSDLTPPRGCRAKPVRLFFHSNEMR